LIGIVAIRASGKRLAGPQWRLSGARALDRRT
jgi:hypothetical protein